MVSKARPLICLIVILGMLSNISGNYPAYNHSSHDSKAPPCTPFNSEALAIALGAALFANLTDHSFTYTFKQLSGYSRSLHSKRRDSDDFGDPLLEGEMPTQADWAEFDRQYELSEAEQPNELAYVVDVPDLGLYSEEFLRKSIKFALHLRQELDQASNGGLRSIRFSSLPTPYFERLLTLEIADSKTFLQLSRDAYAALSKSDQEFFLNLLQAHAPRPMVRMAIDFFHAPDTGQLFKTNLHVKMNFIDVRKIVVFFFELVLLYKSKLDDPYRSQAIYKYLIARPAQEGIFLSPILLSSKLDGGLISAREYRPWLQSSEGREFLKTVRAINPNAIRKPIEDSWARDRMAYLNYSREFAVESKNPSTSRVGLEHGGASIPGRYQTDFLLISDFISQTDRRIMAWTLRELDIRMYSLPPGFVTLEVDGQSVWVGTPHIDTVINVVDGDYTVDGRSKILIDPIYYGYVQRHAEFQRFIKDQNIQPEDLIVIDPSETGLNLTNFAEVPQPNEERVLVLNPGPISIKRLGLKPGRFVMLKQPIRWLARKGGLNDV